MDQANGPGQGLKAAGSLDVAVSQLVEELRSRRLVVFVGAGCSATLGLPSWSELLSSILRKAGIETAETDLLLIATRLEKELGVLAFREAISDRLRTPSGSGSELLRALGELPVNLYLTTNYDHLIEDHLRAQHQDVQVVRSPQDLPAIRADRKTVVKLHGDVDSPRSLVLTSLDYAGYESRNEEFTRFLRSLLTSQTMLFVGVGLRDPMLRRVDDAVVGRFGVFRRPPYIVLAPPKEKEQPVGANGNARRIAEQDFRVYCDELETRGFRVVLLGTYDDAPGFLRRIIGEFRRGFGGFTGISDPGVVLRLDHVESVKRQLKSALEEKCQQLTVAVRGGDGAPTPTLKGAIEHARKLTRFLREHESELETDLTVDAWATVCDALAGPEMGDLKEARRCYERALSACESLPENTPQKRRLLRIRARLLFLEGRRDEALAALDPARDEKEAKLWLTMLADTTLEGSADRSGEGVAFLDRNGIRAEYAPAAIRLFASRGEFERAEKERLKAIKDLGLSDAQRRELDVWLAVEIVNRSLGAAGFSPEGRTVVGEAPDSVKPSLNRALELAEPLLETVTTPGRDDRLWQFAAAACVQAYALLGKWNEAASYAKQLINDPPYASMAATVLSIRATKPFTTDKEKEDLAPVFEKLLATLSETPGKPLWALTARAKILLFYKQQPEEAFRAFRDLKTATGSDEDRILAAVMLLGIGDQAGRSSEARGLVKGSFSEDTPVLRLLEAHERAERKEWSVAEEKLRALLASSPPAFLVPQIHYQLGYTTAAQEKWPTAREEYEKAISAVPFGQKVEVLRGLLYVETRLQDAAGILDVVGRLEKLEATDNEVRKVKAQALHNLGRYADAESEFKKLLSEVGTNRRFKTEAVCGLALTLVKSGKPQEAAQVLAPFTGDDNPTKEVVLLHAHILSSLEGGTERSFELLNRARTTFWDQHDFLMVFIEAAFRSSHEKEGNEAMLHFQQLQQEGKAPAEALQAMSLEQVKEKLLHWRQTEEQAREQYVQGATVRESLAMVHGTPLYLDFAIRTQELASLPTDTPVYADFVTYATTSVQPLPDVAERRGIQSYAIPEDVRGVVIGYDALITLHELGLLAQASCRFDRILYTDEWQAYWLHERSALAPNQVGREKASQAVVQDLDAGRIVALPVSVAQGPGNGQQIETGDLLLARREKTILVDSFTDFANTDTKEVRIVGFRALVHWLWEGGHIPESKAHEVLSYQGDRRPEKAVAALRALKTGKRVVVEEILLEMLYAAGLREALLDGVGLRLVVTEPAAARMRQQSREIQFRDRVRERQRRLTETELPAHAKFEASTSATATQHLSKEHDPLRRSVLATMTLALDRNLPLLCDDRVKAQLMYRKQPGMAFSTDTLLEDMARRGIIDSATHAEAFLQLCRWRYRFLVPTPDILLHFARQYALQPPGRELHDIARYAHECQRDPGARVLLPIHGQLRPNWFALWVLWTRALLDFLKSVWEDQQTFSNEASRRLTRWAWQECWSSTPQGIPPERRKWATERVEGQLPEFIIGQVACVVPPAQEQRLAMFVEESFRVLYGGNDEQIRERVDEAVDFYLRRAAETLGDEFPADAQTAMCKMVLRNVLGKRSGISPRLAATLKRLGLKLGEGKTVQEDKQFVERLGKLWETNVLERPYDTTDLHNLGPVKFIRSGKAIRVFVPHESLLSPSVDERAAAIRILREPPDRDRPYVTGPTMEEIERQKEDLLSDQETRWRLAGVTLRQAVLHDFRYATSAPCQLTGIRDRTTEDILQDVLTACESPNPQTIAVDAPAPLPLPWDPAAVLREATSAFTIRASIRGKLVASWLEVTGNLFLRGEYTLGAVLVRAGKASPPSAATAQVQALWDEVRVSDDPMVVLHGLAAMLTLRPFSESDEVFRTEEFRRLTDGIFDEFNKAGVTGQMESLAARWSVMRKLAHYYVAYLDLCAAEVFSEPERRLVIAWWLAWRFCRTLADVLGERDLAQRAAGFRGVLPRIQQIMTEVGTEHAFTPSQPGVARRQTLFGDKILSEAWVSLLAPSSTEGGGQPPPSAFDGLVRPATNLSETARDRIVFLSLLSAMAANHVGLPCKSEMLPWCWHDPAALAGPRLLHDYYREAIGYLPPGEREQLALAEALAAIPGDTAANQIAALLQLDKPHFVVLALRVFTQNTLAGLEVPEGIRLSLSKSADLVRLARLKPPFNTYCFDSLGAALVGLANFGYRDDAAWLAGLLTGMPADAVREDAIASSMAQYAAMTALCGGPSGLLEKWVAASSRRAAVAKTLHEFQEGLHRSFPRIPPEARDRARDILNLLAKVPTVPPPPSKLRKRKRKG